MSLNCRQNLRRLQNVLRLRQAWRDPFQSLTRRQGWIVQTERILAAQWAQAGEREQPRSGVLVAQRFDCWIAELERLAASHTLTQEDQRCLEQWLDVTRSQRSHLLYWYDVAGLPRTTNDMESFSRSLKTRSRRISGRKNWKAYL